MIQTTLPCASPPLPGPPLACQDVEQHQLQALRDEVSARDQALDANAARLMSLHDALAAAHQALSPSSVAAAFGYNERVLQGAFTATVEGYSAVSQRLLVARQVGGGGGGLLACIVCRGCWWRGRSVEYWGGVWWWGVGCVR